MVLFHSFLSIKPHLCSKKAYRLKPHLEYGLQIWGYANSTYLKKIEQLQKRAIRIVGKAQYNAHTEPIFGKLKCLKIHDLKISKTSEFMFKFINKNLPTQLLNEFTPLRMGRSKKFLSERTRSKKLEAFPKCKFPLTWNNLPENLRLQSSSKKFKKACKTHFLSSYKEFQCRKTKCFTCRKN